MLSGRKILIIASKLRPRLEDKEEKVIFLCATSLKAEPKLPLCFSWIGMSSLAGSRCVLVIKLTLVL